VLRANRLQPFTGLKKWQWAAERPQLTETLLFPSCRVISPEESKPFRFYLMARRLAARQAIADARNQSRKIWTALPRTTTVWLIGAVTFPKGSESPSTLLVQLFELIRAVRGELFGIGFDVYGKAGEPVPRYRLMCRC